jgi:hypothetical protein
MTDKPLTAVQRWSFGLAGVVSGASAGVFAAVALFAPVDFALYARICFAVGALFAGAWAVIGIRVFERGLINLKTDSALYYAMAWILPIFMLTLFMICAPDDLRGLRMIMSGIAFFIGGLAFLLRDVMDRLELRSREHLLKIERQLGEIEKLMKARSTEVSDRRTP